MILIIFSKAINLKNIVLFLHGFVVVLGGTELVAGEDVEQLVAGHLPGVASDGAEHAQQSGTLVVLSRGDVLEVVGRPVEDVAVEVINLHALWPWANPREGDESVAESAAKVSHTRVYIAAYAVMASPSGCAHGRAEERLDLMEHPAVIGENGVVYAVEFACS